MQAPPPWTEIILPDSAISSKPGHDASSRPTLTPPGREKEYTWRCRWPARLRPRWQCKPERNHLKPMFQHASPFYLCGGSA